MAISDRPWNFDKDAYTVEEYRNACLIDRGVGDVDNKKRYALPIREPGGVLNYNGCCVAAAELGRLAGISVEKRQSAARRLVILFRNDLDEDPPDDLLNLAGLATTSHRIEVRASDRPWSSYTESDYTPEQYRRACLIDRGIGDPDSKERYALPVREPSGTLNANGCHAAAGRINQVQGVSPEKRKAGARKLVGLYRSELKEEPPESLLRMAGMATESSAERSALESPRGPIEFRESTVDNVSFPNRVITIVAVPYEEPAIIEYRGAIWQEIIDPNAFAGIETVSPHRIRANRGHDKNRTVGKVLSFPKEHRQSHNGLVTDVYIAPTALGDETLTLADKDCLSASAGFAVLGDGQKLDRRSMTRRITRAWFDHLAFVESPAYAGAQVLSVREEHEPEPLPPMTTPVLDSTIAEIQGIMSWTRSRLSE